MRAGDAGMERERARVLSLVTAPPQPWNEESEAQQRQWFADVAN